MSCVAAPPLSGGCCSSHQSRLPYWVFPRRPIPSLVFPPAALYPRLFSPPAFDPALFRGTGDAAILGIALMRPRGCGILRSITRGSPAGSPVILPPSCRVHPSLPAPRSALSIHHSLPAPLPTTIRPSILTHYVVCIVWDVVSLHSGPFRCPLLLALWSD